MKLNRLPLWLVLSLVSLSAPLSFGAGFALYEGSTRGNALGGLAGHDDDPSVLFYNTAGMVHLDGVQMMAGVTLIKPFAELKTTNIYDPGTQLEEEYVENVFTPPHFYYVRPLSEKLYFGAAFYSRFGLGVEFEDEWEGRYSSHHALIETVSINPSLAWKFNDQFSLALGINATWFDVELESATDASLLLGLPHNDPRTTDYDAHQKIVGNSWGFGFNVSAHYRANDQFSIGMNYYSEIEQDVDNGLITFERPRAAVPDTWFMDAEGSTSIDLPEMLFMGAHFRPTDRFSWGIGAVFTGWSSLEALDLQFDSPIILIPGLGDAGVIDRSFRELNWEDVWRFNIGFEHVINETTNFMWSYIYDESPVPDETISYLLPANDRQLLGVGIRHKMGDWIFDGSYQYLAIKDRHVPSRQLSEGVLETDIEGGAHLLGLSLSRNW